MRDGPIKETWLFVKHELTPLKTQMLLVWGLIAKISRSRHDFEASLQRVPVVQGDPGWRCKPWVRDAPAQLAKDVI
jgi:hypothetical protein